MLAPLIPDNAPFTPEQRAWLNGFFAGLLSLDGQSLVPTTGVPTNDLGMSLPSSLPAAADPLADSDDAEAPWHDPALPLTERMKLAEGRPLRRRMMAAMAQQDCGQCGYVCEDYANALFLKKDVRLNLCVPGGKETQRMLKALYAEIDGGAATAAKDAPAASTSKPTAGESAAQVATPVGYCREKPVLATFVGATRLNKAGSEKETRHVEFDIADIGLEYRVGDSLGLFASNDPDLVDRIIGALGADADAEVGDGNGHSRTLREALLEDCSLGLAPDALFELLASLASDPADTEKLEAMARGEDPAGDLDTVDVLAALEKFPSLRPSPRQLVEALESLQPRLYSIASSPKAMPERIHLTVDAVRYRIAGRERKGVASTFLADRIKPGERVAIYIQRAHGFTLPDDPSTPIIMIGPGTGVAPFRAFLYERKAMAATGKAWLFFGHQRRAYDFFYEDELAAFLASDALTRLSTAFSRDQPEKVYVQHRMREEGAELYRWLEEGAYVYVCGDANRMAPDVDRALIDVVSRHGGRNEADAKAYVGALAKAGRYRKDVY